MNTIADEITRLQGVKTKIKNDLVDKGLPSSNTDKLDVLVDKLPYIYTKAYFDTCMSASNLFNKNTQFKRFISMDDLQYDDTKNVRFFFQTFVGYDRVIPLNTSSGESFLSMYWGSTATEFPDINTDKAVSLFSIYSNCKNAKRVSVLNLKNTPSLWWAFNECNALEKTEFTDWNMIVSEQSGTFKNCHSLKAIVIRSFGANKEFNSNNLAGCYHFDGTVDETYNPNGDKDGYFYVPRANVEELKAATGWSLFGDQIRALEDYTEDGTTTGALKTAEMGVDL
jgi:hypothetical protein